jgi:hypothetical protein
LIPRVNITLLSDLAVRQRRRRVLNDALNAHGAV